MADTTEGDLAQNEVLERFIRESPIPVMARCALQVAVSAKWVNETFEKHSERQYTRELLFSTVVEIASQTALGFRPSLHAAAQDYPNLPVSITSLYNKVNHVEPAVLTALTQGSAARLAPLIQPWQKGRPSFLKGYRVRIVDGNHLPGTEKRLKELRGFRGAALPGYALVVYDPDLRLISDLEVSEDAHAQERLVMNALLKRIQVGELWVADRNFCTGWILMQIGAAGAYFAIREHGANPNPVVRSKWKQVGRTETGMVYEQKVAILAEEGSEILLRRVRVNLDQATEDGDRHIDILTNLPRTVSGVEVAEVYRKRWEIEGMFQRLESVVKSEVKTMGNPKGALLAFTVSVLAYNVLSVIQAAIESAHDLEKEEIEISPYYIALDVKAYYEGMRIAVPDSAWKALEAQNPTQLSSTLRKIARNVVPRKLRNHRRSRPKVKIKKGYAPGRVARRHIATAKVLLAGKIE